MKGEKNFEDLTGKKFNMLTVIGIASMKPVYWECKCDCGGFTKVRTSNLKRGMVKSCGCLSHVGNPKHKLHGTHLYRIYYGIRRRCYNKHEEAYKNYGGRGIVMCDEWKNSVEKFYEWAIASGYKEGLSIDRIDNNGNYSPENCRWVDKKLQANNRRTNVVYSMNGKTMNLSQWCNEYNMKYFTVRARLNKGWTFEDAISFKRDARKVKRIKDERHT